MTKSKLGHIEPYKELFVEGFTMWVGDAWPNGAERLVYINLVTFYACRANNQEGPNREIRKKCYYIR